MMSIPVITTLVILLLGLLLQKLFPSELQIGNIGSKRVIKLRTNYIEVVQMVLDFRRVNILNYLLDYRGMNAKQMTTLIYMTPFYTVSNLKQVQRELKELKDKGLVTSFLYSEPLVDDQGVYKTQKVSMYYLTSKGYNYMLEHYNVIPGQQGSGYLLADDFEYGDIPYEVQRPPTNYIDHHLMTVNTLINLCMYGNYFPHRNNLYAAKNYGENKKLRPDAEVLVNNKVYYLEFDRYTENHDKLVEKFKNYSDYFDTLSKEELKKQGKIIFVVNSEQGMDRRWNNLVSAYFKGFYRYYNIVDLILCTEYELPKILRKEKEQRIFNSDHISYIKTLDRAENVTYLGDKIIFYQNKRNNNLKFSMFIHEFDSSLITHFSRTLSYLEENQDYTLDNEILIIKNESELNWKLNLEHYQVNKNILEAYKKLLKMNLSIVPYYKIVLKEYDKKGQILINDMEFYDDI